RHQPIAVVHEGLLPYLSAREMATVARNIRDLLVEFGGVWITPDFSLKEEAKHTSEQQRRFRALVAAATDRTLYDNAFDNNEQLLTFFESLGLHPQVLNQVDETPNIVSLDALKLPHQILDQKISYHPQSGWFEDTPLKGGPEEGCPLKGVHEGIFL